MSFINNIVNWFGELRERNQIIIDFNREAKNAFVSGVAPTLIKAKVVRGVSLFKHEFSKWLGSGFQIEVLAGEILKRDELKAVGEIVVSNEYLCRKLVSNGWDTLYVNGQGAKYGLKWKLANHAKIGKMLT